MTPLHYAAKNGHWAVCAFIFQNIDVLNPKDKCGNTPFDLAAENGHFGLCYLIWSVVKNKLIDGDEEVAKNMKFGNREEMFLWAAEREMFTLCEQIVQWPLHLAAKNGLWSVCKYIHKKIEFLVAK